MSPQRSRGLSTEKSGGVAPGVGALPAAGGEVSNLASRARSSAVWSASARLAVQLVQLLATIVLARLLTPLDYGLVAYITVFTGFAALLTDLGIGAAVVQLREPTQQDLSTAFWASAGSGLVLTAVFAALSPLLAAALAQPRLTWLLILAGFNFTLALSAVHVAILERLLAFRTILVIETVAASVGAGTSIGLATRGLGPAALVWGSLAATTALTIGSWTVVRWCPLRSFSRASWKRVWAFSGGLLGFNAANYWGRNADNLLVGRVISPATLGLYSRAYSLMLFPVSIVSMAFGRVLFPALNKVSGDQARLRSAYLRGLRASAAVGFPLSIGLSCVAPALIAVVYGHAWRGVAPLLMILSASGPPQIVNGTLGALFKATGRTRLLLRLGVIGAVLCLVFVAVGLAFGATGVVVAFSVQAYLNCAVVAIPGARLLRLRRQDAVRALAPVVVAVALMSGACFAVSLTLRGSLPPAGILVLQLSVGATCYAGALRLLSKDTWVDLTTRPRLALGHR